MAGLKDVADALANISPFQMDQMRVGLEHDIPAKSEPDYNTSEISPKEYGMKQRRQNKRRKR